MMEEKPFKWTNYSVKTLESLIKGMEEHHPEDYKKIKEISDRLLLYYRGDNILTEKQKNTLDSLTKDWYISPENGGVNMGYMYASDWGLAIKNYWEDDTESARKKRLKLFEDLKKIKFNEVYSLSLRSCGLEEFWPNMPKRTSRFDCSYNKIESLVGGPEYASEYDFCGNNIKSFDGLPDNVKELDCSHNPIEDFSTLKVKELLRFRCRDTHIKNLIGCPKVTTFLDVSGCKLTSVEGAPLNLTLREVNFGENVVGEKTLKLAFNSMKKAKGDYGKGLSKIWKKIPIEDQIQMYKDNPSLTNDEVKKYYNLKKYFDIKTFI